MNHDRKLFFAVTMPLLAVLLGLAIYSVALKAPFVFDDYYTIIENTPIKNLGRVHWLWEQDPSRFLTYLSFAVNYRLSGLETFSYHIVNVVLHFCVTALVFIFLKLTFLSYRKDFFADVRNYFAPAFAVFIFLSHPIQTSAVTYISQRSTLLASLCYLASLVFYILYRRGKRAKFYFLSLGVACAGLLTKPIIITLPLTIVLYEVFFLNFSLQRDKKTALGFLPFFIIVVLVPVLLMLWKYKSFDLNYIIEVTRETSKISRKEYLLTEFNVLMTYLRLLFVPVRQNLDYDYPIAKAFFEFPTALSFGALVLIALWAFRVPKKERVLSFAVLWFFLTLSLESSVFPISDVIFEHRLYLPMVGFALFLSGGFMRVISNRRARMITACLLIVVFARLTYLRNNLWTDKMAFLHDVAEKSPNKSRVHNNLAVAYEIKNDFENAELEFKKAIMLDAKANYAHNNLGNIYYEQGKVEEALEEFRKAIKIKDDYEAPYFNMGMIYKDKGDLVKAEEYYKKALEIRPSFPYALVGLGRIYLMKKEAEKAVACFNKSILMNPDFYFAYYNLGDVYLYYHDYKTAMWYYRKTIEKGPTMVEAYNNVGNLLDMAGEYPRAVDYYRHAITLDPQFANAYFNLAHTLQKLGRQEEAARYLRFALHLYEKTGNEKMTAASRNRLAGLVPAYNSGGR